MFTYTWFVHIYTLNRSESGGIKQTWCENTLCYYRYLQEKIMSSPAHWGLQNSFYASICLNTLMIVAAIAISAECLVYYY